MFNYLTIALKFVILGYLVVVMSGCSSDQDNLETFITETRAKPGGRLEPLPDFTPPESFVYAASDLRSPFQRPLREEEKKTSVAADPPDLVRPKEILEGVAIDQITMVGTLQGKDEKLWVLVSDGVGGVYRVGVGNYLGRNFGKITEVHTDKIDIVEVVPDGRSGWLERPRTIELKEK